MHKNSLYEMRMKCRRLVVFVCLPLFLFFVTNVCAAEAYPAMRYAGERPMFQIQRYPEEGFGAGTLVCVPNGYKPIEILDVHIHADEINILLGSMDLSIFGNDERPADPAMWNEWMQWLQEVLHQSSNR